MTTENWVKSGAICSKCPHHKSIHFRGSCVAGCKCKEVWDVFVPHWPDVPYVKLMRPIVLVDENLDVGLPAIASNAVCPTGHWCPGDGGRPNAFAVPRDTECNATWGFG